MKKYVILINCFLLLCAMFIGCGGETGGSANNRIPEAIDCTDVSNAEEISPDFTLNLSDVLKDKGKECAFSEFVFEDKFYYVLEYAHDGAQYSYKYEIYEDDNGKETLLYSSDSIVWLNEFTIHMGKLFWVEFTNEEDHLDYKIIQYDLDSGSKECIAEYSSADLAEILLTSGDGYLAWYENSEDNTKLKYYDIRNKTVNTYDKQNIAVLSAYDRPEIVKETVTFFAKEKEKLLYVNYNLKTKKENKEAMPENYNFVGYAANSKGIAWFTNFVDGKFFFFNLKNNKLSNIVFPDEINIFSLNSDAESVYFNMRGDKNYLFAVDNDKKSKAYEYTDQFVGTHFGRNKYGSYIRLEKDGKVGVKLFY